MVEDAQEAVEDMVVVDVLVAEVVTANHQEVIKHHQNNLYFVLVAILYLIIISIDQRYLNFTHFFYKLSMHNVLQGNQNTIFYVQNKTIFLKEKHFHEMKMRMKIKSN